MPAGARAHGAWSNKAEAAAAGVGVELISNRRAGVGSWSIFPASLETQCLGTFAPGRMLPPREGQAGFWVGGVVSQPLRVGAGPMSARRRSATRARRAGKLLRWPPACVGHSQAAIAPQL